MPSSSSRATRKATTSGASWITSAARPTSCTLMSSTFLRRRMAGHSASAQSMVQLSTIGGRARICCPPGWRG
eukprot:10051817-Lingulodinium_polyedra.AAC.1